MTSRTRIARRVGGAFVTARALGVAPSSAQAATIGAEGGALVIRAAPGEANFINFGPSDELPGLISISDTATLQYDPALCQQQAGRSPR
jgi:hypothetical protein